MQNAGLDETQAGIKIARRNINKLRYADDTTLMAEPVHPKGDQSWVFIGRTNVEVETPVLWPPDVKNWLIGKDPDAGKDWGQEKGTTEDEMFGWHHQLNGHGFWQTQAAGDGQGGLVYCSSWGTKLDMTEWLNWTELMAEGEEELKSLLVKVKEDREKAGLKLNIHKTKIIAFSPITS